jgi:hypothetical protein
MEIKEKMLPSPSCSEFRVLSHAQSTSQEQHNRKQALKVGVSTNHMAVSEEVANSAQFLQHQPQFQSRRSFSVRSYVHRAREGLSLLNDGV